MKYFHENGEGQYISLAIEPQQMYEYDGLIIENTTESTFHVYLRQLEGPIEVDVKTRDVQ